jgi:anti-anti-sigma factor
MEALRIRLDDSASPSVLIIEGEIDLATVDHLRAGLERALTQHTDLVVDLGGVTFLGAAGLRVFLRAASALNGSGPLRFVHAARLAWLLDTVGVNTAEIIDICDAGTRGR